MRTLLPKLVRLSTLVLALVNLVVIGFLVWAAQRGLDATDEGLYLLLSDPTSYTHYALVHYNILFSHLYELTGWHLDIFSLRYLRIAGVIAGTLILWSGLREWMPNRRNGMAAFVFLLLTGWLSYTGIARIQTPGYNAIAIICAQYWVGIFLLWWKSPRIWQPFIFGGLIFIFWLTKFTIAIVLPLVSVVMVALYVFFHGTGNRKRRFRLIFGHMLLTLGVAGGLIAVHIAMGYPIGPADYIEYLKLNPDRGHSAIDLIIGAVKYKFQILGALSGGAIAAVLVQSYVQTGRRLKAGLLIATGALLILPLVAWTGVPFGLDLLMVFGTAYLVAALLVRRRRFWSSWPIVIWLVFIPLIVSFGTNTPLLLSSIIMLQFPLAAALMMDRLSTVVLGLALAVIVPLRLWQDQVVEPYRQPALTTCTGELSVPQTDRTLLVPPVSADYFQGAVSLLNQSEIPYVVGSSRFMTEVYLAEKQYPSRILWYEENITEDYFDVVAKATDAFMFVQVNDVHAEWFAPHLKSYEMEPLGSMNRRTFMEATRPYFLHRQEEKHAKGTLDSLTVFLCRKKK